MGGSCPTGELVDTLWGDEPPASAAKSLQTFVLRLRNALEPDRNGSPTLLLTEGPGYRLALDPSQVDAERFARLARIGERSLADGRPENAAATLTEALALWRGPAYAGFDGAAFAVAEARRLEELRISATEDRLAAELALGRAAAAVPELERLVGEHPMRERLWEMLVTALYRAGRQGDALGAYERARAVLADELGVDPGPGLRAVHARVLAHDPTLGVPDRRGSTIPPQLRLARALVGRDEELAPAAATPGSRRCAGARPPSSSAAPRVPEARPWPRRSPPRWLARAPSSQLPAPAPPPATGRRARPDVDAAAVLRRPRRPRAARRRPRRRAPAPATLTLRLTGHLGAVPEGAEVVELTPLAPHEVRQVVADYVPADEVTRVAEQVHARTGGWPGRRARGRGGCRPGPGGAAGGGRRGRDRVDERRAGERPGRARRQRRPAARRHDGCRAPRPARLPVAGPRVPTTSTTPAGSPGASGSSPSSSRGWPGSRLLALVGASGSGKSSALRAGLLVGPGRRRAARQRRLARGHAATRARTRCASSPGARSTPPAATRWPTC